MVAIGTTIEYAEGNQYSRPVRPQDGTDPLGGLDVDVGVWSEPAAEPSHENPANSAREPPSVREKETGVRHTVRTLRL